VTITHNDDIPCLAEAGGAGRTHLGAIGIPPVELGLREFPDLDPVDLQVSDVIRDFDIVQFHSARIVTGSRPG